MSIIKNPIVRCALVVIAFSLISPASALHKRRHRLTPTDQDQTLQKLVNEVHELRLAVQRATANSTRFEILIERTRLQQSRVDSLSRQLENIHSQIADLKAAKPQLEQQNQRRGGPIGSHA
jgi:DNA repair exonuclease SbcCD ATPase subunit